MAPTTKPRPSGHPLLGAPAGLRGFKGLDRLLCRTPFTTAFRQPACAPQAAGDLSTFRASDVTTLIDSGPALWRLRQIRSALCRVRCPRVTPEHQPGANLSASGKTSSDYSSFGAGGQLPDVFERSSTWTHSAQFVVVDYNRRDPVPTRWMSWNLSDDGGIGCWQRRSFSSV